MKIDFDAIKGIAAESLRSGNIPSSESKGFTINEINNIANAITSAIFEYDRQKQQS